MPAAQIYHMPTDPRDPRLHLRWMEDVIRNFAPATPEPLKDKRSEELELLGAMEVLRDLIVTYGAKRVATWTRNLAAMEGQGVVDDLAEGSEQQ